MSKKYLGGGSLKSLIQTILTTFPTSEITEDEINDMYYPPNVYGFSIDQTATNSDSAISYIGQNVNYTAAQKTDAYVFDYGDWKDAFFIKNLRPCMLNYDGTEAYLLDPNDYSKKLDSTDSDIDNSDFAGNVMVGIPKVYFKIVKVDDDHINFYFSDKKVDDNYHCWAHINNYGDEVPYYYLSIYFGQLIDGKIRSFYNSNGRETNFNFDTGINDSGIVDYYEKGNNIKDYAMANNINGNNIWGLETYSSWLLITLLSILIFKDSDISDIYRPFGSTCIWGNYPKLINGFLFNIQNRQFLVKLTYGTQDGSTVEGYNFAGDGYIEGPILSSAFDHQDDCNNTYCTAHVNTDYGVDIGITGRVSKMKFTEQGIMFPVESMHFEDDTAYRFTIFAEYGDVYGDPITDRNTLYCLANGNCALSSNEKIPYNMIFIGSIFTNFYCKTSLICLPKIQTK
jgi:hypothetical protein